MRKYQFTKSDSFTAHFIKELDKVFRICPLRNSGVGIVGYDELLSLPACKNYKNRSYLKQVLQRLSDRGLFSISYDQELVLFSFSRYGLQEIIRSRIYSANFLPAGQICIVIFDIPESKKVLRENLRSFLKASSFIGIQRSVWVSRSDVGHLLEELFCLMKIRQYIRIYIAEEQRRTN